MFRSYYTNQLQLQLTQRYSTRGLSLRYTAVVGLVSPSATTYLNPSTSSFTMPGKQPRAGEHPLSRAQSVIAAQILREHFDPSVNTQMDMTVKNTLIVCVCERERERSIMSDMHDS